MSYPRGLDEMTDDELRLEIERRAQLRHEGRCTYCERPYATEPCRFPERHAAPAPETEPAAEDCDHAASCGFCRARRDAAGRLAAVVEAATAVRCGSPSCSSADHILARRILRAAEGR